jgi:uncharacterized protein (DUF2252 family)
MLKMRRTIATATREYETWLATYTSPVKADLALKHVLMKRDAFSFFRATFYRWMQVWPNVCAEMVTAPEVLAVGDLHLENFGTWRDTEGRLIWGINDFDEAYPVSGEFLVKRPSGCERVPDTAGARHIDRVPRG